MPPVAEPARITVVGVVGGSTDDQSPAARAALAAAEVVIGSERQLEVIGAVPAERVLLPSPLLPALGELLDRQRGRRVVVLASGDPMFYGIGATVVRLLGAERVDVVPAPSSVSLAAARLGWALQDVDVISAVGRPLARVVPNLAPGRRILVLMSTTDGGARVRELVTACGYGASAVTVLSRLGYSDEQVQPVGSDHDALAVVAVECVADENTVPSPRTASLPDDAFAHDGQITKREIRAVTLSSLAPLPGQLLWDVGAGSGSVGVEWMRHHASCRAIAVEPRADRSERIVQNAESLGTPGLRVVIGSAPDALVDLPQPDAVFVGGAVSVPGVLEVCHAALRRGGRLVANGVTLETESVLAGWYAKLGGSLTRIHVERAAPVGGFSGWRPAMPVTQWVWTKR